MGISESHCRKDIPTAVFVHTSKDIEHAELHIGMHAYVSQVVTVRAVRIYVYLIDDRVLGSIGTITDRIQALRGAEPIERISLCLQAESHIGAHPLTCRERVQRSQALAE